MAPRPPPARCSRGAPPACTWPTRGGPRPTPWLRASPRWRPELAATATATSAATLPRVGPPVATTASWSGSPPAAAKRRARREARGIAAVYSSPLERARETAAPIAAAVGCDVRADDGLLELDVGSWTGLELKAATKRP